MEASGPRDLMSDDEWAFFERFIMTVQSPNGRKRTDGLAWARPARGVRQVVVRLPPVPTLYSREAVGADLRGAQ